MLKVESKIAETFFPMFSSGCVSMVFILKVLCCRTLSGQAGQTACMAIKTI